MKGWVKRRTALILAIAVLAAQMSACANSKTVDSNAETALNNENAVVMEQETTLEEVTSEEPSVLEWLKENFENIRQSLMAGEYAKVVEQLLEMKDELINDARYNALLYIAYMGNGNDAEANALLDNAELNLNEFTNAFLESAAALLGNKDMPEIERKLMLRMLSLGESNPDGFAAAARVGQVVQNSDPSDPTAYAARYIAALAQGDEAAIAQVLEDAKANGISAEVLSTTTVEYIEQYNLTNFTASDVIKGIETSTTYNVNGNVVSTQVTVENSDGTKTKRVRSSTGILTDEALFGADGKMISATHYIATRVADKSGVKEAFSGRKEVYSYKDGVIDSVTTYDESGEPLLQIELTSSGSIVRAKTFVNGEEKGVPQELLNAMKFVVEDGQLISITMPNVENGVVAGKTEICYDYTNPVGLWTAVKEYNYRGKLVREDTAAYTFNDETIGEYSELRSTDYDEYLGTKLKEYIFTYTNGVDTQAEILEYDWQSGDLLFKSQLDYVTHTAKEIADGMLTMMVMDEKNEKPLSGVQYFGETVDSGIYKTAVYYYDEKGKTSGEDTITYRADGTVEKKEVFKIGPQGDYDKDSLGNPIPMQATSYDETGRVTQEIFREYDETGTPQLVKQIQHHYGEDGSENVNEYADFKNGEPNTIYVALKNPEGQLTAKLEFDYNSLNLREQTDYTYVEELGQEVPVKHTTYTYDENGKSSGEEDITYRVDGTVEKKEVFVRDPQGDYWTDSQGNPIPMQSTSYDETGKVTVESFREYDENGIPQRTKQIQHYYGEDGSEKVNEFADFVNGAPNTVYVELKNPEGQVTAKQEYDYNSGNLREQTNYYYGEDGTLAGYSKNIYNEQGILVDYINYDAEGNVVNPYMLTMTLEEAEETEETEEAEQTEEVTEEVAEDAEEAAEAAEETVEEAAEEAAEEVIEAAEETTETTEETAEEVTEEVSEAAEEPTEADEEPETAEEAGQEPEAAQEQEALPTVKEEIPAEEEKPAEE